MHLVPWKRDASHNSRAGHPGWRRCSSLTYSRYARSSRLAIRAPRSGIWYLFSGYRPLAATVHRRRWGVNGSRQILDLSRHLE